MRADACHRAPCRPPASRNRQAPPDHGLRRNSFVCPAFWWKAIEEWDMDNQTKHEIWVLTLSTLATVPVMVGLGFAVVSGIVGF